jgi:hypothetical protein
MLAPATGRLSTAAWCRALAAGCAALVASLALHAAPPFEERTLLLVDDHDVLYRAGTERVLQPLVRHPANPVVAETQPWELAIGWTSIYRDPRTGKYQLWYQAHAGQRARQKSHETVVCFAESTDGVRFIKPQIDLFAFNDIAQTNIVLVGNGGYGDRYGASVLVDERETDPARRYKLAYYDWSLVEGREYAGLHVAFSPDGIHWTKQPGPLNRTAYGARGEPKIGTSTSF